MLGEYIYLEFSGWESRSANIFNLKNDQLIRVDEKNLSFFISMGGSYELRVRLNDNCLIIYNCNPEEPGNGNWIQRLWAYSIKERKRRICRLFLSNS